MCVPPPKKKKRRPHNYLGEDNDFLIFLDEEAMLPFVHDFTFHAERDHLLSECKNQTTLPASAQSCPRAPPPPPSSLPHLL